MKFRVLIFLTLFLAYPVFAGPFAKEANENPFLDGELNPKYEGEVTALAGEIVEIKPTKQKFPVYKLNLRVEGIKPIWVTSIASEPEGGIKIGDMIIFQGFIATANGTDPDGDLEKLINSKTLLMAIKSQRAK